MHLFHQIVNFVTRNNEASVRGPITATPITPKYLMISLEKQLYHIKRMYIEIDCHYTKIYNNYGRIAGKATSYEICNPAGFDEIRRSLTFVLD